MSGKSVVKVVDKRTVHTDALDILGRVITEEDNIGRDAIHLAVEPVIAGQTLHAGMEVGRREDGTFGYSNITKTLGIVDPFIRDVIQIGQKFLLVIYPRQITTLRHVWEHPEFGPEVINPAVKSSEPKLYHLILTSSGPNKINTIKAIRAVTNLGLKEAKDVADGTPSFILENVTHDAAGIAYDHIAQWAGVQIVEAKPQAPVTIPNPNPAAPGADKVAAAIFLTSKAESLGVSFNSLIDNMEEHLNDPDYYWSEGDKFEGEQLGGEAWKQFEVYTGKPVPDTWKNPDSWDGEFFTCSC